jgi:hypothetical protein
MKKPWCQNRDRQKKEQDDSPLRFAIGSNPCSEFRDKSVCCFAVRCDLADSRADISAVIPFKKSTCSRIAVLSSDKIGSHSDSRAEIARAQSFRIRSSGIAHMAWQDCQRRITKHHPVCRVANPMFSPELSVRSVTTSYQVRSSRRHNNGFMNAKLHHGDGLWRHRNSHLSQSLNMFLQCPQFHNHLFEFRGIGRVAAFATNLRI